VILVFVMLPSEYPLADFSLLIKQGEYTRLLVVRILADQLPVGLVTISDNLPKGQGPKSAGRAGLPLAPG
jgi:hypothetical protein